MDSSKLVILDRDGVINQQFDNPISSPDEWVAIPGSLEAIARLCREDYRIVVMTNQGGIARGLFSINTLNRIHQKMLDELNHLGGKISAIFFCPHDDAAGCRCRKPATGMYEELTDRLKCNLDEVCSVGDSLRDLQAAAAAGARPILVRTGHGTRTLAELESGQGSEAVRSVPVYPDLSGFVSDFLKAGGH